MAGGLFGTPLALNPKCLVFAFAIIGVYYLPQPSSVAHNIVMIFLLGTAAYIALAWYDVIYDCNDRLQPTLLGWMSKPFKPKEYSEQYKDLPLKTKKVVRNVDIAVLTIIAVAFIYPFVVKR